MNKTRQKWIVRIAMFLFAGAVLSVGVAFACAACSSTPRRVYVGPRWSPFGTPMSYPAPTWEWREDRGFGLRHRHATFSIPVARGESAPRHDAVARPGAPWWVTLPGWPVRSDEQLEEYFLWADAYEYRHPEWKPVWRGKESYCANAAGWPLICISGTWLMQQDSPHGDRRVTFGLTRYEASWPASVKGKWIPLHPLWIGVVVNSVFYASVLGLLTFGPGAVRSRLRRRKGLCPACAYDLQAATSPICPECGSEANADKPSNPSEPGRPRPGQTSSNPE